MSETTLIQISDLHLSRSRPFFQFNYEAVLLAIAERAPDAVIVTGDIALNGPDDADDIVFAAEQLDRLPCPWFAVPGNHDVGLVPFAGGLHQPIDAERLATYRDVFGGDRFVSEISGWTFIGLNSQLMGSGLHEEAEQLDWFEATLSATKGPAALFLHYPLFLDSPDDAEANHTVVVPAARAALMAIMAQAPRLKLVASGHLHEDRRIDRDGVIYQWAPATAFMSSESGHGGDAYNGFLSYCFDGDEVTIERVEPTLMINHDIRNWGRSTPHGYYEIVKRAYPAVA